MYLLSKKLLPENEFVVRETFAGKVSLLSKKLFPENECAVS